MAIIEVSVVMDNKPGQLSLISELMGEHGLNILALNVSTREGLGWMHFIPTDPAKAAQVLQAKGYQVDSREVLACQTPHHPGGLNALLKPLKDAQINVDHLYPCIGTASGGQTVIIMAVSDVPQARQALKRNWIIMVGDEIYRM